MTYFRLQRVATDSQSRAASAGHISQRIHSSSIKHASKKSTNKTNRKDNKNQRRADGRAKIIAGSLAANLVICNAPRRRFFFTLFERVRRTGSVQNKSKMLSAEREKKHTSRQTRGASIGRHFCSIRLYLRKQWPSLVATAKRGNQMRD